MKTLRVFALLLVLCTSAWASRLLHSVNYEGEEMQVHMDITEDEEPYVFVVMGDGSQHEIQSLLETDSEKYQALAQAGSVPLISLVNTANAKLSHLAEVEDDQKPRDPERNSDIPKCETCVDLGHVWCTNRARDEGVCVKDFNYCPKGTTFYTGDPEKHNHFLRTRKDYETWRKHNFDPANMYPQDARSFTSCPREPGPISKETRREAALQMGTVDTFTNMLGNMVYWDAWRWNAIKPATSLRVRELRDQPPKLKDLGVNGIQVALTDEDNTFMSALYGNLFQMDGIGAGWVAKFYQLATKGLDFGRGLLRVLVPSAWAGIDEDKCNDYESRIRADLAYPARYRSDKLKGVERPRWYTGLASAKDFEDASEYNIDRSARPSSVLFYRHYFERAMPPRFVDWNQVSSDMDTTVEDSAWFSEWVYSSFAGYYLTRYKMGGTNRQSGQSNFPDHEDACNIDYNQVEETFGEVPYAEIDLTHMHQYKVRDGFEAYGGAAFFRQDKTLLGIYWCHGQELLKNPDFQPPSEEEIIASRRRGKPTFAVKVEKFSDLGKPGAFDTVDVTESRVLDGDADQIVEKISQEAEGRAFNSTEKPSNRRRLLADKAQEQLRTRHRIRHENAKAGDDASGIGAWRDLSPVRYYDLKWKHVMFALRSSIYVDITTIAHLLNVHYTHAGSLTKASQQHLSASHPLRRLVKPFTFRSDAINRKALELLSADRGICHRLWAFKYPDLVRYMDDSSKLFQHESVATWLSRKPENAPFVKDAAELYDVLYKYADKYVTAFYKLANGETFDKYVDFDSYEYPPKTTGFFSRMFHKVKKATFGSNKIDCSKKDKMDKYMCAADTDGEQALFKEYLKNVVGEHMKEQVRDFFYGVHDHLDTGYFNTASADTNKKGRPEFSKDLLVEYLATTFWWVTGGHKMVGTLTDGIVMGEDVAPPKIHCSHSSCPKLIQKARSGSKSAYVILENIKYMATHENEYRGHGRPPYVDTVPFLNHDSILDYTQFLIIQAFTGLNQPKIMGDWAHLFTGPIINKDLLDFKVDIQLGKLEQYRKESGQSDLSMDSLRKYLENVERLDDLVEKRTERINLRIFEAILWEYQEDLQELAKAIDLRNRDRIFPITFLNPRYVDSSVSI